MSNDKLHIWEATELRPLVEEIITTDNRFAGFAGYISNVYFYWSTSIPTACAGHGFIFFNPNFWEELPEETRKTVIAHEIWHLILRHLERGKNCDPDIHNQAADHVINLNLEADGFTFKGTEPLKDSKYGGKSTETVYNIIYEEHKKNGFKKNKPGNFPSSEKIEDMVKDAISKQNNGNTLDKQIDKNNKDVDKASKNIGSTSGNKAILLKIENKPIMVIGSSYHEIFEDYLTDPLSGGKRTFMRPNRRQVAMRTNSLRLPGRYPKRGHINRLTHLVYALDVSGSITHKQAQQFHNSVKTIKELLNPSKLTVMFFDTEVKLIKEFTDKEPYIDIKVRAGGGTSLTGVYQKVKKINPEALVIFTDLQVTIPSKPSWNTIWLVPSKNNRVPKNIYGDVYLIPS